MNQPTNIVLVALAALALTGAMGAAHARNYVVSSVPTLTCFDKDWSGLGGAAGDAVNGAIDTADPLAPDNGGTCYRAGHITPNVNGDVTFTVSDAVATTVGFCVSQDSDGDDGFCFDDGDVEETIGCNAVTVNTGAGFDFGARTTYVIVDWLPWASGIWILLLGDESFCAIGADDYGTTGNINH